MKQFDEFKKVFDNGVLHDYAVEVADKNEEINPGSWDVFFNRGAMLDLLRQYHEWLNSD